MRIYQLITEHLARGESLALATVIRSQGSVPRTEGAKMLIYADGSIEGTIGGGEMEGQVIELGLQALKDKQPQRTLYKFRDPDRGDVGVCGGEMEVLVEPILPESRLVIIGAGHVGQAIAYLAAWLGYQVAVVDDRPGFATPENVPDAQVHLTCAIAELPGLIDITENDYLVLTTRGVTLDIEGLPGILATEAAYIGVIGSKRRWETTRDALLAAGVDVSALNRVHSPIGLEIKAESPEEIAVSVMAEIIMHGRGGSGESMVRKPK